MKKVGGKKNYGYGRQLKFAIRSLLEDRYGSGRFGTRCTYVNDLVPFQRHLKERGVTDLRRLEAQTIIDYGSAISAHCEIGEIAPSTGANRITAVNALLSSLPGGRKFRLVARDFVPARCKERTTPPLGLEPEKVECAVDILISNGEMRIAIVIAVARFCGARIREASLLDLGGARRSIRESGEVIITKGTKGGRGESLPRHIAVDRSFEKLINRPELSELQSNVIPTEWSLKRWNQAAHRIWRKWAPELQLSTKFHELRAAYACVRYEELTGVPAPCVGGRSSPRRADEKSSWFSDTAAREIIALELGHSRISVIDLYIGAPK